MTITGVGALVQSPGPQMPPKAASTSMFDLVVCEAGSGSWIRTGIPQLYNFPTHTGLGGMGRRSMGLPPERLQMSPLCLTITKAGEADAVTSEWQPSLLGYALPLILKCTPVCLSQQLGGWCRQNCLSSLVKMSKGRPRSVAGLARNFTQLVEGQSHRALKERGARGKDPGLPKTPRLHVPPRPWAELRPLRQTPLPNRPS